MDKISLRLYMLISLVLLQLKLWAQDAFDDDLPTRRLPSDDLEEGMNGMMEYSPVHIKFSDIMTVIVIVISCYVFGKIWKGCTYAIIVMAALYYFCVRF